MTQVAKVAYQGWPNCFRLSNELVELIIITDVGPRLIRFGFLGRDDLAEFPADLGQAGGNTFQQYGGHRLWHGPESRERTYYPDNAPVMLEQKGEGVRVIQPDRAHDRCSKGDGPVASIPRPPIAAENWSERPRRLVRVRTGWPSVR